MDVPAAGAFGSDMVQWCRLCCFLSVFKRSVTRFLCNWCNAASGFLRPSVQSSHRLRDYGRDLLLTRRRLALSHCFVLGLDLPSATRVRPSGCRWSFEFL